MTAPSASIVRKRSACQASSASYYYLVERSGSWDTRDELMDVYLDRASHVYTEGAWGEPARAAYEAAAQGTEVVLRTWFDHTTSPLSNKRLSKV